MSSARTLLVLAAVAVMGCESPQAKSKDAEEARAAADKQAVQIALTTEKKEGEIQQKADRDMNRVEQEGAKKVLAAQVGVDRKENEATLALWEARGQAQKDAARKLDGLDHDVAELRPKLEKKLSPAEATTVVQDLQTRSAALRRNITGLEQCTVENLDATKKLIKSGFDDLERSLADAKSRV